MQYKDENGVNEPSRRRLLKVIGALALAGSCPVAHAQKTQSAPGTLSPDARNEKQPFYGEHQAGILTPQQAAMMLVAFDVLASDKADLERSFRLLTQRFAFLTQGGAAPETPIRACHHSIPAFLAATLRPIISPSRYRWVTHCLMSALALRHRCQKSCRR